MNAKADGASDLQGNLAKPKFSGGGLQWDSLGQLRNVSILRIGYFGAIFVPSIAYAIALWNEAHPHGKVSLPLNLFLTFLGSSLLAAGHLLNEVFTPKLIKEYGTLTRYRQALAEFAINQSTISRATEAAEAELAAAELANQPMSNGLPPEVLRNMAVVTARVISRNRDGPSGTDDVLTSYAEEWKGANKKNPLIRWGIAILYSLAAFIAAYLAIMQLRRVFQAVDFGPTLDVLLQVWPALHRLLVQSP